MITSISFRNGHKAPPKFLGHLRLRELRRQPFILLSFSSPKKARKVQETQSYQRIQCIGHMDFKGLSNAVTNTHPLLPSMGTTRQKSSCRNRLQNGPRLLPQVKAGTHSPSPTGSHTAAYMPKQGPSGRGRYHYPRSVSHVSETLRGQGVERQTLPLLGLGRVCSRRTQKAYGTAMCLCASLSRRRRGPAGLRRPTPPAERTVLAPISPRVQLCLRRPAFPLSAFIPGA